MNTGSKASPIFSNNIGNPTDIPFSNLNEISFIDNYGLIIIEFLCFSFSLIHIFAYY